MGIYWLWFALLEDITLRQKLSLLERYSDPEAIYQAQKLPDEITLDHDLGAAERILMQCRRKGIRLLPFDDAGYPNKLRNIEDPPLVLYYRGVLPAFDNQPLIGVVGTRKASGYGLRMAEMLSQQIAQSGAIVVSGGALGIDTGALIGAQKAEKPTVVVLGCGIDVTYPVSNRKLFAQLEEKGCLLSEYPPGTEPKHWHFPERNRIISGISNGVLVVEAPQKSGALITARNAMEQGRDVYVVPGNIDTPSSMGSNMLLQEGAEAVLSGWDVVRQYAGQYAPVHTVKELKMTTCLKQDICISATCDKKDIDNPAPKPYSDGVNNNLQLTEEENLVLSYVERKPMPVDMVIERADMPAAAVLRVLTKLSLHGMVVNHPGKLISRNR